MFNGVLYAHLGWHRFKQEWITTKYVLPSVTAKHSHYNLETMASGSIDSLTHTGFLSRMKCERLNKKTIWKVLLDPMISDQSTLSLVCLLQFYAVFSRSLLCHACLKLHYVLTSDEKRDFSAHPCLLELFCLINQLQPSFVDYKGPW